MAYLYKPEKVTYMQYIGIHRHKEREKNNKRGKENVHQTNEEKNNRGKKETKENLEINKRNNAFNDGGGENN